MKKLPVRDLQPGQIVARPVVADGGVVLMRPGVTLGRETISRLMERGISAVWVEGHDESAKSVDQLIIEMDQRFAGHEQNPLMQSLRDIVANRIRQGAADDRA